MLPGGLWCTTVVNSWTTFVPHIEMTFQEFKKTKPNNTNLFISDSNIENLFETMKEVLRKVATWFKAKKLSLNISNTKYFLFYSSRKRKCMPNILPPLHIDKVPIKREFVTKILQLYIDGNISCKYHMNIASTLVCKSIRILYRTRYIVNKFLRKQLYFSLKSSISPSETWGMDHKLQRQIYLCKTTTWTN